MFTVFFTSGCFTTGLERQAAFPQGLKPTILLLRIGTAKVMPFQNRVMKQLLFHCFTSFTTLERNDHA
jgi:hypothetical protein